MTAPDSLEAALRAGSETAIKAWLANVVSLIDWDDQDALDELVTALTSALAAAVREWIRKTMPTLGYAADWKMVSNAPTKSARMYNMALFDVARSLGL